MTLPGTRPAMRRVRGLVSIAALCCATPVLVIAQGLTPEQVVTLQSVTSVAISPDGQQIAYTLIQPRGEEDLPGPSFSELWVVPATGGASRAIVRQPISASRPSWSPDGQMLTFVGRIKEHHPQTQVYGVPAAGGEPRQLTNSPDGVMAYAWSPSGDAIAYTARESVPEDVAAQRARGDDAQVAGEGQRHVRLWLERLGTGGRRALTPENRTVWAFAWAPDGRTLAVQTTSSSEIDHSYMFRQLSAVSVTGGSLMPLTETPGKLGGMAWSPDGAKLAFLGATSTNDPLAQSVFVVPAGGGQALNRTPGYSGSATWVGWLDDGTLLFMASEGTQRVLNRIGVAEGGIEPVLGGGSEILASVNLDSRRRTFAAVASTARYPAEVHTGTLRRGSLERITHHNDWLDDVQLASQETIEWTSPDGHRIQGVLIHPLNEQPGTRYPLAILPHGGPEGISLNGWTTRALYPAQVLAARGYAVLMPNYRGSAGRGVAFSKADHRDLGGKEFEDVIAAIDHLSEVGLVDPERVGISGTSYGGYFSAWAGTRHSERFKAAITFAGISNWVSFTGTTDIPYEMSLVHWDLWWFDNPGIAWDRSPLAHVDEDDTPTLVVHGAVDQRVHPGQSRELYQLLKLKGVPTGLVVYPREPHGLRERMHQLDFMHRAIEWLDRHLRAGRAATE